MGATAPVRVTTLGGSRSNLPPTRKVAVDPSRRRFRVAMPRSASTAASPPSGKPGILVGRAGAGAAGCLE